MSRIEEEVKIRRRLLHVFEMVIGRSPQEVGDGLLRQVFHARVQCLNDQRIVFILAGGEG